MSRLRSWRVASLLALDHPLLGGGFTALDHGETHVRYGFESSFSAHSVYFAVLGDHGFVALGLFIFLLLSCLGSLSRLRLTAKNLPGGGWFVRTALMFEASFVAYMVSGAFVTMAYFDVFYHLVSFVILLKVLAKRELSAAGSGQGSAVTPAAQGVRG